MSAFGRRQAVAVLFLFAVSIRLAVVAGGLALSDRRVVDLASLHDGREYQKVAAALTSVDELRGLRPKLHRIFPGYPVLIRVASTVVPMPLAAIMVAILSAAAAVVLLHALGADRRAAAVFAVMTPSWLMFTSSAMSEGPFLALVLAAVVLWRQRRTTTASVVFGAATHVRPVGLLVFLSVWALEVRGPDPLRRLRDLVWFAVLPVAWSVASWLVWRNPAEQVSGYLRKDISWPLHDLLLHLLDPVGDPLKWLQTCCVLALTATAAIVLVRRFRRTRDRLDLQCLVWLSGMTAFHLLLPSTWVFECLPRFLVAWLPPIMLAIGPHLPRARWFLALATSASMGLSVYWLTRALGG